MQFCRIIAMKYWLPGMLMPILFPLIRLSGVHAPITLYHYDIANNVLKPCFTFDNVMQEDKYIVTSLHETPEYYWVE